MTADRLLQTLFILLEKGSATAPELAERFEVSVRTIYRDLDHLSAAGIPVYAVQGKGGGIFLQEQYVLNKSVVTETEQEQILMALQGLNIAAPGGSNALLTKLGGVFQKQNTNWIEVDFSDWRPDSHKVFPILQQAIFLNRTVAFTYHGQNKAGLERTAEPLKLVFKERNWYLYAYCLTRNDYRLFKLSRIKELKMTDRSFVRTAPEQVFADNRSHTLETVDLTLCFKQTAAYLLYDHFDSVEPLDNGGYLVHASIPDNDNLYRFLLSFGDAAEVLEPPKVREQLKKRIDSMQKQYIT